MQITRRNNRGDSAHTSIPASTVPPASLVPSGCQPCARTDHIPAPGSEAQILLQHRLPDGYPDRLGKAPRSLICCNATAS